MFTVLVCCSSSGHFLPAHYAYKGKRAIRKSCIQDGSQNEFTFSTTPTGWLEADHFAEWFKKTFVPHANTLEGEKILFLDGHHSHISAVLFDLATQNSILLAKQLVSCTSHSSQSLDVSVFRRVILIWRDALDKHFEDNSFRGVTKSMLPTLMKIIVESSFEAENVIPGFRAVGIYPLKRDAIIPAAAKKRKISEKKAETSETKFNEPKTLNLKLSENVFKKRRLEASAQGTENTEPIAQSQTHEETCVKCSACLTIYSTQLIENGIMWKTCFHCENQFCGECVAANLFVTQQFETEEFCCSNCSSFK